MNERTYKIMPLTMKWIFVRLFLMIKKDFEECTTKEEQCMWLLKNIKSLKDYPKCLESSEYKSFAVSAEIAYLGSRKKQEFDKAMTYHEHEKAVRLTQYRLGKAEGRAEANFAVAKAMIADGMPLDKVSLYSGIPIDKLKELQSS